MSYTLAEIEEVTNDIFMLDNGKATDIYYNSSFLLDRMLKKKSGLYKKLNGGGRIRVPLEYDIAEGGSFTRTDALSNDDKEMVDAAYFLLKNYYGNATINWVSERENTGPTAMVDLVAQKVASAQKRISKDLGQDIYSSAGDSEPILTGLLSLCNASTTREYGSLTEAGLVATDGTKPWKGNVTTASTAMSLKAIQELRTSAKINDGAQGKPNIGVTTEALFNSVARILQAQQRFTQESESVKAGFTNLVVEGLVLAVDDYMPSGHMFVLNDNFVGFAEDVAFERTPWAESTAPLGRSMKILWRGNIICSNRKAHAVATAFTVPS